MHSRTAHTTHSSLSLHNVFILCVVSAVRYNPTRHIVIYPPCRRRWLVKDPCGRGRARMGASYQCLPTVETKPKSKCSCMWNPLPNLTSIRARGAKPLGAFGLVQVPLPIVTIRPFWLCPTLPAPLPTLTTATDQTKRPLIVGQYRSGCG